MVWSLVSPLSEFALPFNRPLPYPLINLPPLRSLIARISSTWKEKKKTRFQLFMPVFHKYLGDGISKQTMPGDTNPRLLQRSFNALEIWPAVDRHLLLSSSRSRNSSVDTVNMFTGGGAGLTPLAAEVGGGVWGEGGRGEVDQGITKHEMRWRTSETNKGDEGEGV